MVLNPSFRCGALLAVGMLFFAQHAFAQQPVARPKRPTPLTVEISGGLRLNTTGWGLYGEYGKIKSDEGRDADKFYDVRLFTFSIDEVKQPKEQRYRNDAAGAGGGIEQPRPYIYGKVNNFYAVKLGYGGRKMIAGKPERGTVSVHWSYQGGVAAGLLKPYYLDAFVPQDNRGPLVRMDIKYEPENSAYFLDRNYIIGSSGFMKGLGEIKVVPGAYLSTGLHFDFSQRRKLVMALDAGIRAEYYTQKIELMASQDSKPYIISLFAGIQFGGRK